MLYYGKGDMDVLIERGDMAILRETGDMDVLRERGMAILRERGAWLYCGKGWHGYTEGKGAWMY